MFMRELLHDRQIYKNAGRQHFHTLIIWLVKMPARRVDRDDEVGGHGQRTFQKTIVRRVTDDIQFSQRITRFDSENDALQQIGIFRENFLILLNHRGRSPSVNDFRQAKLHNQSRRIDRIGQSRKLEDASIKDDFQGKAWRGAARGNGDFFPHRPPLPRRSSCDPRSRDARARVRARA